jgi:peptide/nickel transport system substrate-binding protein
MYPYDPAKAKELLARAGYPNGFEMQLTTTLGRYALDSELGQAVVSYLQQVGIKVKHDALEFGAFVRRRDANLLSNNLVGNLAPPEPHFNYLRNVKGAPRAQFEFPDRYDELVEAAAAETDQKKREPIYHRLAILVNSNPNWIFLHVPNDIYAASKRVTGFQPPADQVLWLYRVGKAR